MKRFYSPPICLDFYFSNANTTPTTGHSSLHDPGQEPHKDKDIQAHKHTSSQTYKLTNIQAHKYTSSQTYKLTNIQAHKHTSSQTYKLTNIQAHKHTSSQTYKLTNSVHPARHWRRRAIASGRNNLLSVCSNENGYLERADSCTCNASRNYK